MKSAPVSLLFLLLIRTEFKKVKVNNDLRQTHHYSCTHDTVTVGRRMERALLHTTRWQLTREISVTVH